MFLSFLGCDGSGKSAVISGVAERLEADGVAVTRGHWRPQALDGEKPATGGRGHVAADDPHGQVPRGMVSSIFKLGWLWLNWWGGWFRFLRKQSATGLVVFDRYHADLLVDPKRYRYGGPMGLARLASRLMPQPDIVIFLDAEPEVLLARKQEVSREALERSRTKYLELCASHPLFHIVDASKPLEEVVGEVWRSVGRGGLAAP
jgi:thymidylate kinase